jgi:RNA polymerase sigma factor (sigma-70 family)
MQEKPGRASVEAFLRGEASSVEEVRALVESVVRSFSLPESDQRRDLVQEVLGRIVASLRSGRFRGDSSLSTYAYSTARYACIEHMRRSRREALASAGTAPEARNLGPEASLIRSEEQERGLRAIRALPREAQDLLRLIFIEGLPYHEVGLRFGLTEAAIKSRIHRCRLMLRGEYERDATKTNPPRRGANPRGGGTQEDDCGGVVDDMRSKE